MVVGACGGGSDSPEEVVRDYFKAFADGDGEAACDRLTDDAKREVVEEFDAASCEDGIEEFADDLDDANKDRLRDSGEATVDEHGDTATVFFEGAQRPLELTKSGGDWLISGRLFYSR